MFSSPAASRTKATSSRRALAGLTGLLLAALACGPLSAGPDTVATVNAVSTRIQATLDAATPAAPSPSGPSLFPGPTETPALRPVSVTPPDTRTPPPPSLPAATPEVMARPNGPLIVAPRLAAPPVIDGAVNDWPDLPYLADQAVFRPEAWTGAGDASVRFAVGWDAAALYLAAAVTDDAHVQTQRGEALFRGDSLEILLDADLRGDFADARLSADDVQLGLSPGDLAGATPEGYLWFPAARAGPPGGLVIAAQRADTGYTLEAAIPWAVFNASGPLLPEKRFGFTLSVSDNDTPDTAEQQSMVASAPGRRLTDPTTWGILALGD